MVKKFFFFLFIFVVSVYPIVVGSENYVEKKKKEIILPEVEIKKGNYFLYKEILEKNGSFSSLKKFDSKYVVYNLVVDDLIKKAFYKAKKTLFFKEKIVGFDVYYKDEALELISDKAIYDKTTKELKGEGFKLFNKDIRGYGSSFVIDKNKNIFAKNVTYFIKVDK
ncbi:MAG: hypothetical protein ABGX26_05735 [Nautiliaceae bacterium]